MLFLGLIARIFLSTIQNILKKANHVNKLLIILSLALSSTQAMADWTMVQTNDEGYMYIDFDTVQKSGNLTTVSTLNDYFESKSKKEMSSVWSEQHDCKNKKFKAISINYFAENMGQGKVLETYTLKPTETAWTDVVQYSVGDLKANIICSR